MSNETIASTNVTTPTHAGPKAVPTPARKRGTLSEDHKLFLRVLDSFIRMKLMPTVAAITIDPQGKVNRWTPTASEYLIDVRNATRKALSPELYREWCRLVVLRAAEFEQCVFNTPIEVSLDTEKHLVTLCVSSGLYDLLDPRKYFIRIRGERTPTPDPIPRRYLSRYQIHKEKERGQEKQREQQREEKLKLKQQRSYGYGRAAA